MHQSLKKDCSPEQFVINNSLSYIFQDKIKEHFMYSKMVNSIDVWWFGFCPDLAS